jgi:hypothetical protein
MTLDEIIQRLKIVETEIQELHNALMTLSVLVHRLEGRINTVAAVGSVITPPNIRYKVQS